MSTQNVERGGILGQRFPTSSDTSWQIFTLVKKFSDKSFIGMWQGEIMFFSDIFVSFFISQYMNEGERYICHQQGNYSFRFFIMIASRIQEYAEHLDE